MKATLQHFLFILMSLAVLLLWCIIILQKHWHWYLFIYLFIHGVYSWNWFIYSSVVLGIYLSTFRSVQHLHPEDWLIKFALNLLVLAYFLDLMLSSCRPVMDWKLMWFVPHRLLWKPTLWKLKLMTRDDWSPDVIKKEDSGHWSGEFTNLQIFCDSTS